VVGSLNREDVPVRHRRGKLTKAGHLSRKLYRDLWNIIWSLVPVVRLKGWGGEEGE